MSLGAASGAGQRYLVTFFVSAREGGEFVLKESVKYEGEQIVGVEHDTSRRGWYVTVVGMGSEPKGGRKP